MRRIQIAAACLGVTAGTLFAVPVCAHGALAFGGNPEDKSKGNSYGLTYDYGTKEDAEAEALRLCREQTAAPAEARADCKIVGDVLHQWIVVAKDPQVGEPGIGWAAGSDRAETERQAIALCAAHSPVERKTFCAVRSRHYDQRPYQLPKGYAADDFDLPPAEQFEDGDYWNAYSPQASAKAGSDVTFAYQKLNDIWVLASGFDTSPGREVREFTDPAAGQNPYPAQPVEGQLFASSDGLLHRFANGKWIDMPMGSDVRAANGAIFTIDRRVTPAQAAQFEGALRGGRR